MQQQAQNTQQTAQNTQQQRNIHYLQFKPIIAQRTSHTTALCVPTQSLLFSSIQTASELPFPKRAIVRSSNAYLFRSSSLSAVCLLFLEQIYWYSYSSPVVKEF